MGHGGDGKTTLAESLLFMTKAADRMGKVADGNTVCDFDQEEIRRKISIGSSIAPVEYNGCKINLLDTPGYFDFVGEVLQSLRVADIGVIVCAAKSGVNVGAEKAWKLLAGRKLPRAFYISRIDEENADFFKAYASIKEAFGNSVCPLYAPAIENGKAVGIIDIAAKKAVGADGKPMDIPAGMSAQIDDLYNELAEHVAETDEALMERFFEGEAFTADEITKGLSAGIAGGDITPVLCGSAINNMGGAEFLKAITAYGPCPAGRKVEKGVKNGEPAELAIDQNGPAAAIVFKTLSDQYGKFSFFKVISGKVTSDMTLVNARTGQNEKMGHIYVVRGKKNTEVKEIGCGDIGAVSKLADLKTGDTLCDPRAVIELEGVNFPEPCYALAFMSKVKGGEEKIATGLSRISEEDLSFIVKNDAETKQFVVTGQGDIHLDVLCSRLKSKFGAEVETESPRVAYREKIRKKVTGVEGKHKKQSGGHGQFGLVIMDFEPGETEDLIFEEKIFGGSVPKNFHPAVEKGLRERIQRGVLAGYPVVNLKATLVDGKYHDVDSSEMAFKLAAGLAYKSGLPQASPVLLEPIGSLKVSIPDSYTGDIMGDLNKRRGRVMGMNPAEGGGTVVEAEAPMSEMHSYAIDLRSMTQGRGSFTFKFERYDEAPPMVQQKVIESAKARMEEDDD
ncbi:MAG: elongation factor G [Oscillospiraceae bacterium]|nr:elongation factor G [Oscillospiraceae bacterium]